MCIPGFFNNGRFMNIAYDMLHGGVAGSMNLMFNQNIEHCMTFPMTYSMPDSLFNFNYYGNNGIIGSNNYLLDPRFPMYQAQFGMGNQLDMSMMPWWMDPEKAKKAWSFNGTDSTTSSDPTVRKYNKMYSLLNNIAKSDEVKQSVKDEILNGIKDCKGTTEEKLEKLTAIYEKLDKEVVKKALKEANNVGYAGKSSAAKDSFKTNLESIGFEYAGGEADKLVSRVYDDIKTINADGSVTGTSIVGAINEDNILDFISSWNTVNAGSEEESDRRVLSHIAEYYNNMTDGQATVRSNLINPLVTALKDKATDLKADLPKEEKAKIEKAVKELSNAWDNGDEISEDMIKAFDNLYVLVRMAALTSFNEEVTKYYGELDEDLFNEEFFVDETIEDLKAEGFSKSAIQEANADVEVSDDEDGDSAGATEESDDTPSSSSSSSSTSVTQLTSGQVENAYELGKALFKDLNGITTEDDWSNIKVTLKSVNANNVLEIIRQFNHSSNNDFFTNSFTNLFGLGHEEGFFEWVSRENGGNKAELQKTILEYVIKHAEAKQKNASSELKAEYKDYIKDLKAELKKVGSEGLETSDANYVDKIVRKLINLEETPSVKLK